VRNCHRGLRNVRTSSDFAQGWTRAPSAIATWTEKSKIRRLCTVIYCKLVAGRDPLCRNEEGKSW